MAFITGRHNHALTAVSTPEQTPEEKAAFLQGIEDRKAQHLGAIAAQLPNSEIIQAGRMPNVQAVDVHGMNISAFTDFYGQVIRMEIFEMPPSQAAKLAQFIAHELLS